jgi:hypothetical protein
MNADLSKFYQMGGQGDLSALDNQDVKSSEPSNVGDGSQALDSSGGPPAVAVSGDGSPVPDSDGGPTANEQSNSSVPAAAVDSTKTEGSLEAIEEDKKAEIKETIDEEKPIDNALVDIIIIKALNVWKFRKIDVPQTEAGAGAAPEGAAAAALGAGAPEAEERGCCAPAAAASAAGGSAAACSRALPGATVPARPAPRRRISSPLA